MTPETVPSQALRADVGPDWQPAPARRDASRRSRLEILMDVLRVIRGGSEKPTQIMYKANLSWMSLHVQLTRMLERGLISWASYGESKKYQLTPKGASVLYAYTKVLEEVGDDATPFEAGF